METNILVLNVICPKVKKQINIKVCRLCISYNGINEKGLYCTFKEVTA